MEKKLIIEEKQLTIIIDRICHQLIEKHQKFDDTILIGLQPKGIFFAKVVCQRLQEITKCPIKNGYLDITFYRDDFRKREKVLVPNSTKIEHSLEDKAVIIIDDVLYTGRSVRSALDSLLNYGRPKQVELLILVNRLYERHLPIEPNYVGIEVDTFKNQVVLVEWKENNFSENKIWLISKDE